MTLRWISTLEKSRLFAQIPPEQLEGLLNCFQATARPFARGDLLCLAGQPQTAIGIVLSGRVQVLKEDPCGKRLILGIFGPGELFGEIAAFSGNGTWPSSVQAASSGHVLYMPYEKLSRPCCLTCEAHHQLTRNLLHILAEKALLMNKRISFIRRKGMREKLSAYLYDQYTRNGSRTFHTAMNREELADYLNVSRPSMSRELGRMKHEALIDYFRSSFTILDPERLLQGMSRDCQ